MRAVANNTDVTSCVDKWCISFKTCQIKTVAQFGIIPKYFCLPASFFESSEPIKCIFFFLFQTLELLYRITNGQNVVVIVQKMLDYLKESKEEYAIISLVGKIAELAEKYPFIFWNFGVRTQANVAFLPFKASFMIFWSRRCCSCAFHSFKCKKKYAKENVYKNDHSVSCISLRESNGTQNTLFWLWSLTLKACGFNLKLWSLTPLYGERCCSATLSAVL